MHRAFRKEALDALDDLERRIELQKQGDIPNAGSPTLGEILRELNYHWQPTRADVKAKAAVRAANTLAEVRDAVNAIHSPEFDTYARRK